MPESSDEARRTRAHTYNVATEAGVGIATLYRRFPDRGELIAEAFADALAQFEASTAHALAADDPWDWFADLVNAVGDIEARNRGFTHLIQSEVRPLRGLGGDRAAGQHAIAQIIRRGQDAGVVRADLAPDDVPVISFAIAGILETTRDDVPDTWRRHVALLLDGCRAGAASTPLPPRPSRAPCTAPCSARPVGARPADPTDRPIADRPPRGPLMRGEDSQEVGGCRALEFGA